MPHFWWNPTLSFLAIEQKAWLLNDPIDIYFHIILSSISKLNICFQKTLVDAPIFWLLIVSASTSSPERLLTRWFCTVNRNSPVEVNFLVLLLWWSSYDMNSCVEDLWKSLSLINEVYTIFLTKWKLRELRVDFSGLFIHERYGPWLTDSR